MDENTFRPTPSEIDFFLQLTDLLADAYLLLSPKGTLLAGNASARKMFGGERLSSVELEALVSDPPGKVFRSLQLWSASGSMVPTSLTLRNGSSIRCDGAAVRKTGCPVAALLLVRCTPRENSPVTQLFVRHSTEYTNLQREVTHKLAEERRSKEILQTAAAVFAHELANPLNGISTSLQLLAEDLEKCSVDPAARDIVESTRREINRITRLINDFRALARPQVFEFRPTDIATAVQEVLTTELPGLKAAGIVTETEFDPALPRVMADANKLKQAILNVCKNARDAMPRGGLLKLKTYESEGIVFLDIIDTGTGIPEDFDPFQISNTTKPDGTGLGLAITSQIISAHRGAIDFTSKQGYGTTFTIRLPASAQHSPPLAGPVK